MSTPSSSSSDDLIEILDDDQLDPTRYTAHVRLPSAGAVATFEGTTRDTFDGRRVVELRYEAYVPMARREISSILCRARDSWAVARAAVAHRLGVVPVGEASVFVAVSAVHRDDALEACRFVIDEVKARVPIWKKEVYDDGEVWKENKEFFHNNSSGGAHDKDKDKNKKAAGGCGCGSKVRVEKEEAAAA